MRRNGFGGVTTMVLVVLLLLLPFSLMLSGRSRGLTALLHRYHENEQARALAALVLEEAVHRLRLGSRTPGTEAFDFFRSGHDGDEISLGEDALPHSVAELARLDGYSLDEGVRVRMLRQGYVGASPEALTGYEVFGVVRLTVRVLGPGGVTAQRIREYGFRRSLAAPPRPLDRPTFLLADARSLITRGSLGDHANRAMRRSTRIVSAFRETLREDLERFREIVDGHPQAASMLGPVLEDYRAATERYPREEDDWTLLPPGSPTEEKPRTLHLFHRDLAIYTTAEEVELEPLDLPTRIRPHTQLLSERNETVQSVDEERRRLAERIVELAGGASGLGALEELRALSEQYREVTRQYLDAVLALIAGIDPMLQVYKDFQDRVEELGGAHADFLRGRFTRLDEVELRRKAHFLFLGDGAAERAEEFLSRKPTPTGFVFVENPETPLTLDLKGVSGRLVVAATGEIEVRTATVADRSRDQITLVSPVGVANRGKMDAAVLVPGGRFDPAGTERHGSLVLEEIFGDTSAVLRGKLRRQAAVQTSAGNPGGSRPPPRPETLHVELDPYPLYRKVTR